MISTQKTQTAEDIAKNILDYFDLTNPIFDTIRIKCIAKIIQCFGDQEYKRGEKTHLATCSERFDEGWNAAMEQTRSLLLDLHRR